MTILQLSYFRGTNHFRHRNFHTGERSSNRGRRLGYRGVFPKNKNFHMFRKKLTFEVKYISFLISLIRRTDIKDSLALCDSQCELLTKLSIFFLNNKQIELKRNHKFQKN